MQRLPDPGPLPVAESPPAGTPAPAAERAGERVPAAAGLQHEHDPAQRATIGQPRPPALAVRRAWREERRDQRPQVVGDERFYIHSRETTHPPQRLCNE